MYRKFPGKPYPSPQVDSWRFPFHPFHHFLCLSPILPLSFSLSLLLTLFNARYALHNKRAVLHDVFVIKMEMIRLPFLCLTPVLSDQPLKLKLRAEQQTLMFQLTEPGSEPRTEPLTAISSRMKVQTLSLFNA
jgi:hypothetical protein